ncbi:hypothetical protein [Lutibaculum baratangense]|uniref:Uncharacterized protein n=1 Tax=Lutibaculum baratangense AMV1 TaxID=631454 RepID=V4RHF2_9HYPH|nr:hypothetical protein [Lutibaculum baratangense]ESR22705.1 hypothetical protein N177_3842 [Lutibaculum baratangense AMV1]
MTRFIFIATTLALLPTAASAYVGPGAGLSLLGALWALVAAVGLAIAFVVAWPIRKLMRRRKGGQASGSTTGTGAGAGMTGSPSTAQPPREG